MKLTPPKVVLVGIGIIALFGHLYSRSSGVKFAEHDRYERGLQRLKQLDTAFNVDVLKARYRLLNNYDGFAAQLREASETLKDLQRVPIFVVASGQARLATALTSFASLIVEKSEGIEDFKTQNSVVRNSLSYFPTAGSELVRKASAAPDGRELQLSFDELMRLILVYSLTAQEELEPQIEVAISKVRAWAKANPAHTDTDIVLGLVAHAKTLLSRKPKVDELTMKLVSLPTGTEADGMLHMYQEEFSRALQATQAYRLALFLCCVALLGGIAWTMRALRLSNLTLENRVQQRTGELSQKNSELHEEIVHRQRTEAALRDNEERFRTLSTSAPSGIFETDDRGHCLYVNPRGLALLGLTLEESLDHGWHRSIHPEDTAETLSNWRRAIGDRKDFDREFRLLCKGETFWIHLRSAGKKGDNGVTGYVGMMTDITARKRAEEERQRMEVQLRHAQKMESIGQLAAGIAHEINTPTQYIGDNIRFIRDSFGGLQSLLDAQGRLLAAAQSGEVSPALLAEVESAARTADVDYLSAEMPRALGESLNGVERVTNIVRAMKEFSHPGTTEKTAVDLNRAIESTLTVCSSEWKYVAELVTRYDVNLPPVPVLPGEFNQVVLNIVINATHAIADVVGDGGKGKGKLTISTHLDGDWVEIRIADTGTGIPEHARAKIFDPFFTTKGVGKGTGQGLAIAHSVIVEKHGGTIHFETESLKGTTFVIRLPLASGTYEEKAA